MKTLFDPAARADIIGRIDRLAPERLPLWGGMNAPQMLTHVGEQLRNALGDMDAQVVPSSFSRPPMNWLLIHVVPWPKARAKSPPEFLVRPPAAWDRDMSDLKDLIRRFAERSPSDEWPVSAAFGRISGRDWGVLTYKHLDHHLRQFGA